MVATVEFVIIVILSYLSTSLTVSIKGGQKLIGSRGYGGKNKQVTSRAILNLCVKLTFSLYSGAGYLL